ncbi:unnamed protein product [Amoebophrya sp. A120]|nr:unnamed protein product [Amoebophrya sp. A120]|eukprot:GSA120T00013157001.1
MGVLSSPNASTSPAREGGPGRWQYYNLDDKDEDLDDKNFDTTFVVPPVGDSTTSCGCSPRTEAALTWRSLSDARILQTWVTPEDYADLVWLEDKVEQVAKTIEIFRESSPPRAYDNGNSKNSSAKIVLEQDVLAEHKAGEVGAVEQKKNKRVRGQHCLERISKQLWNNREVVDEASATPTPTPVVLTQDDLLGEDERTGTATTRPVRGIASRPDQHDLQDINSWARSGPAVQQELRDVDPEAVVRDEDHGGELVDRDDVELPWAARTAARQGFYSRYPYASSKNAAAEGHVRNVQPCSSSCCPGETSSCERTDKRTTSSPPRSSCLQNSFISGTTSKNNYLPSQAVADAINVVDHLEDHASGGLREDHKQVVGDGSRSRKDLHVDLLRLPLLAPADSHPNAAFCVFSDPCLLHLPTWEFRNLAAVFGGGSRTAASEHAGLPRTLSEGLIDVAPCPASQQHRRRKLARKHLRSLIQNLVQYVVSGTSAASISCNGEIPAGEIGEDTARPCRSIIQRSHEVEDATAAAGHYHQNVFRNGFLIKPRNGHDSFGVTAFPMADLVAELQLPREKTTTAKDHARRREDGQGQRESCRSSSNFPTKKCTSRAANMMNMPRPPPKDTTDGLTCRSVVAPRRPEQQDAAHQQHEDQAGGQHFLFRPRTIKVPASLTDRVFTAIQTAFCIRGGTTGTTNKNSRIRDSWCRENWQLSQVPDGVVLQPLFVTRLLSSTDNGNGEEDQVQEGDYAGSGTTPHGLHAASTSAQLSCSTAAPRGMDCTGTVLQLLGDEKIAFSATSTSPIEIKVHVVGKEVVGATVKQYPPDILWIDGTGKVWVFNRWKLDDSKARDRIFLQFLADQLRRYWSGTFVAKSLALVEGINKIRRSSSHTSREEGKRSRASEENSSPPGQQEILVRDKNHRFALPECRLDWLVSSDCRPRLGEITYQGAAFATNQKLSKSMAAKLWEFL